MTPEEEEIQMELEQERALQRKIQEEERARQQLAQQKEPMGWGIFLFGMFFCVIADIIDAITVGTIGWLIGLFVDFILLIALGISKAGRKQWKKWLTGLVGEKIPIISALPLRTSFLIWSFVSSRSKTLQKATRIASIASKK